MTAALVRRYGHANMRRGPATEAVFKHATACKRVEHSSGAPPVESERACTIREAQYEFATNKRAKMTQREDGAHVFVVGHPWGWIRYELR